MAVNVLEAVRGAAPEAVVVASARARQYGPPDAIPLTEDAAAAPAEPVRGVSKAAGDMLAGFYADAYGLRVIRARAFNHAGPGQEPRYAIAAFARQPPRAWRRGRTRASSSPAIPTRGATTPTCATSCARTGCSPRAASRASTTSARASRCSARELSPRSARSAGARVRHEVDPARVRAHEVIGDARRRRRGWRA